MAENILIAGANGIIGKALTEELLKRKRCIRLGVHSIDKAAGIKNENCPVVIFDYEKPETYKEAFEGIQSVFLATPIRNPRVDQLIIPVINAAKKMGVTNLVTLGTVGLNQESTSPLSILEKCVQHCGISYTILRPNLLMQNIIQLACSIKKSHQIRLPAGNALISFVDARDVALAAANILSTTPLKNQIYILTGKESLNLYQVAHILSKVSNQTITYIPISHSESYKELFENGIDQNFANFINGIFEIARQGWCETIHPDLKELIEQEPRSFEQFAWDYADLLKC